MATTPNQPTLPLEADFTDAEHDFIESSPEGLFPENQDSNFGLLRKAWTDRAQELIQQQDTIYNERFVATSGQYLDMWELDVGLPTGRSATRTVAQRRLDVLSRLIKGPFTVPLRNRIIENAITATFGTVPALFPEGIPITAAGIPLYSEAAAVTTLYSVRDNNPVGKNLVTNGNFETDLAGWGGTATVARSTTHAKAGVASMSFAGAVNASAGASSIAISGATAGRKYTLSVWVFASGSDVGKTFRIQFNEAGGASAEAGVVSKDAVLVNGWQQIFATGTIVQNDRTVLPVYLMAITSLAGILIDEIQLERVNDAGPASQPPTGFSDSQKTPYYYEVRISNGITPDMTSLIRELKRITPASIAFDVYSVPPGDV